MPRATPTSRAVDEWRGATPDAAVPTRVKVRVFEAYGGRCYLTKQKIHPGDAWEIEHVRALGLGGENRESNLAPVLVEPHKAKTRNDRARMTKADRQRAKHLGAWPKTKRPLQGRGFAVSRPLPREF